ATSNETIQKARQTALSILSPRDADLLHGLELHEQSIVFDAYGFSPRAAIDAEAYNAAIAAGASQDELLDLSEELSKTTAVSNPVERAEFLDAFRAAGVTCIFQNSGEEGNDPLRMLRRLSRMTYLTDMLRGEMFKAVSPDDVVAAKRDARLCLALTTNGVPLRQQWDSVRDELRMVRLFYLLGVRMMHVTYNRRNLLGDGAGEPNDGGLSDFGHAAVGEMNRVGMIVDVAHSGWRTSLEAAKASTKPMVASHTTCAGLYKHFRGKPDDVIRAICDTGGLVGICCIPRFLGGKGDIAALLDHIDYAVSKFGADHVAIGTDIAYTSRNEAAARKQLVKQSSGPRRPPKFGHLWPEDSYKTTAEAEQSIAWTNWPLFTVGMVMRGHSDETIRKILGENMLRVWRANQPELATG
ncbi:MAG TPA: membrane dipeptidase, partial [Pirellulales bacterium]|nr:membrane dipeptidase [Pirellulales bacterium]